MGFNKHLKPSLKDWILAFENAVLPHHKFIPVYLRKRDAYVSST
jgi:hypothetical protein